MYYVKKSRKTKAENPTAATWKVSGHEFTPSLTSIQPHPCKFLKGKS
jgi:hypothetical protein